ncbi:class I SAM-dependent methyltransferase [Bacillus sp. SCS-151]|uniref:class I SAM-dependent methyltransferase n=1 Tax=Nanhaiella sioensis TaxID=3115293 RepID=UPI00397B338E
MNNKASLTAIVSAFARSYHSQHHYPIIFDDFLAQELISDEESAMIGHNWAKAISFFNPQNASKYSNKTDALNWVMSTQCIPQTVSRAKYVEDCLENAITRGVEQYIILGAGFDTFAYRKTELINHLQVFELDHPATQTLKIKRMAELKWEIPNNVQFIPIDFTEENITNVLIKPSFSPKKLTFISWLGVTYYLTIDTLFETLHALKRIIPTGSSIVFDYLDDTAFDPDRASKRILQMQEIAKQTQEPLKTGLDPNTMDLSLQQIDMLLYEHLSPEDIDKRYFNNRHDLLSAFEHFYFAHATF